MKLVTVGKGAKVHDLKVNRNIMIVDDITKIDSLIELQENGEIIYLTADGNEVHTEESYAKKVSLDRARLFTELNIELNNLTNMVTKAKLEKEIQQLQSLPHNPSGEHELKRTLGGKVKDLAIELGAKVVAEVITKQTGL